MYFLQSTSVSFAKFTKTASTNAFVIVKLCESDVPGAVLQNKNIHENTQIHFKRWLECRGLPVSGDKAQLVESIFFYLSLISVTYFHI